MERADYNAGFWTGRTLDQFMETWGRAYRRLRPLLPEEDLISGPAFATELHDGEAIVPVVATNAITGYSLDIIPA
jgi:hypothetical protein